MQHCLGNLAFDAKLNCGTAKILLHRNGADDRDVVALVDYLVDVIEQELPFRVEVGASLQMRLGYIAVARERLSNERRLAGLWPSLSVLF